MVVALLVLALGTIYGLGAICFFWWDGGTLRRTLMLLCVAAIAMAALYAYKNDLLPKPHSSVTRRA